MHIVATFTLLGKAMIVTSDGLLYEVIVLPEKGMQMRCLGRMPDGAMEPR